MKTYEYLTQLYGSFGSYQKFFKLNKNVDGPSRSPAANVTLHCRWIDTDNSLIMRGVYRIYYGYNSNPIIYFETLVNTKKDGGYEHTIGWALKGIGYKVETDGDIYLYAFTHHMGGMFVVSAEDYEGYGQFYQYKRRTTDIVNVSGLTLPTYSNGLIDHTTLKNSLLENSDVINSKVNKTITGIDQKLAIFSTHGNCKIKIPFNSYAAQYELIVSGNTGSHKITIGKAGGGANTVGVNAQSLGGNYGRDGAKIIIDRLDNKFIIYLTRPYLKHALCILSIDQIGNDLPDITTNIDLSTDTDYNSQDKVNLFESSLKSSGTSLERPNNDNIVKGTMFFDETLGKPIFWTDNTSIGDNGWVDANGNNPSTV